MCCVANEHTDEPLSLHSLHSTYIQIYLLHREVRGQGNTEQVLSIHCLAYAPHEYTWSPWIGLTVFILWRASPIVSPHVIVEADLTLNTNILYHQRENDNKKIESSNKTNGYWKDAQNCWPQIHLVCAHAVTVICSLIAVLIPRWLDLGQTWHILTEWETVSFTLWPVEHCSTSLYKWMFKCSSCSLDIKRYVLPELGLMEWTVSGECSL